MKSIMEPAGCRTCWECREYAQEEHHVFGGTSNRKLSERYGLKVHMCTDHHRDYKKGVHGLNKDLDRRLKEAAQREFEKKHSRKEFVSIFGRNYLPEEE